MGLGAGLSAHGRFRTTGIRYPHSLAKCGSMFRKGRQRKRALHTVNKQDLRRNRLSIHLLGSTFRLLFKTDYMKTSLLGKKVTFSEFEEREECLKKESYNVN